MRRLSGTSSTTRTATPAPTGAGSASGAAADGRPSGSGPRPPFASFRPTAASPATTFTAGKRTVKTEPTPTRDSSETVPPATSTRRLTIASPSPVPSNTLPPRRERSCSNGLKTASARSGAMPIPVSATRNTRSRRSPDGSRTPTHETRTPPFSVYLTALLMRLKRIWRMRWAEMPMTGSPGCRSISRARPFFFARPANITCSTSKRSGRLHLPDMSILPASICERSRTSLISESSTCEERRMPSVYSRTCSFVRFGRLRKSANPTRTLSGVRISWLIVERNWLFASPAARAATAERRRRMERCQATATRRRSARTTPEKTETTIWSVERGVPSIRRQSVSRTNCSQSIGVTLRIAFSRAAASTGSAFGEISKPTSAMCASAGTLRISRSSKASMRRMSTRPVRGVVIVASARPSTTARKHASSVRQRSIPSAKPRRSSASRRVESDSTTAKRVSPGRTSARPWRTTQATGVEKTTTRRRPAGRLARSAM